MSLTAFARTLDQELVALARGVAYECPCCGEFVLHEGADVCCPECGLRLPELLATAETGVQLRLQAG
jgi:Zn finger protein HypA/HybF involved in hydrogenase expression